jgi:O-antigen/teichoic acid export membrane protein
MAWMMASQISIQGLSFLTSIATARLLSPRDVGLATEAIVFAQLALVIADFGVASVIIQRPELSEQDSATAFWVSTGLGVALTALGVGASWPIAALYGQPEVQPLFAVLSFIFLLTAPGIVQGALLTRELEFRALEIRNIVAVAVSSAVAVGLAAAGFGAWAIVAQSLVIAGLSTVLLWRSSRWRPQWMFAMQSVRDMAEFAAHTFGARTVAWAQLNADNFLVGRFLGAAPLGAYSIASSVSLTPVNRVALPIAQVFFPAFSRIREPERIAEVWLRALRMVALIVVPIMLGLVIIGQEFVIALFGHKWHEAITPLELLAPIGLLQALAALSNGILQAIGRARLLWRATAAISATSLIAFGAGLPWGIDGVAVAYLIASVVVQPAFLHVSARAVGLSLWDVCRALSGLLQAGFGMMAFVFVARRLLLHEGVPVGVRLLVLVIVGAVSYVPLVLWRAPQVRREITDALRDRAAPPPGPPDVPGSPLSPLVVGGE